MKRELILGWIAAGISILVASLWAFWGTIEAFHEGWWQPTLGGRIRYALMYLTPMAIVLLLTLLAIRWPRLGGLMFFAGGAWFSWIIFLRSWPDIDLNVVISWLPVTLVVVGVGLIWWFGRPEPQRLAPHLLARRSGAPAQRIDTRAPRTTRPKHIPFRHECERTRFGHGAAWDQLAHPPDACDADSSRMREMVLNAVPIAGDQPSWG